MQITIALPDNLPLTEADVRIELAIVLYQQYSLSLDQAAQLAKISADDFYQILIDRNIVAPPPEPDDEPAELILASLRNSMQQVKEGKVHPISQLWMERSNALKKAI
jgi:predicted HTH domain antitoxin